MRDEEMSLGDHNVAKNDDFDEPHLSNESTSGALCTTVLHQVTDVTSSIATYDRLHRHQIENFFSHNDTSELQLLSDSGTHFEK